MNLKQRLDRLEQQPDRQYPPPLLSPAERSARIIELFDRVQTAPESADYVALRRIVELLDIARQRKVNHERA